MTRNKCSNCYLKKQNKETARASHTTSLNKNVKIQYMKRQNLNTSSGKQSKPTSSFDQLHPSRQNTNRYFKARERQNIGQKKTYQSIIVRFFVKNQYISNTSHFIFTLVEGTNMFCNTFTTKAERYYVKKAGWTNQSLTSMSSSW